LVIYLILGLVYIQDSADPTRLALTRDVLQESFRFHWLLLLPPLMVLVAAVRKMPTIPAMLSSAFVAAILALIFQGQSLVEVFGVMVNGFVSKTGNADLDQLLSRGGMMSMMGVTLIAFCAFAFAGIIRKAGMLDTILEHLVTFIRSRGSLILTTAGTAVTVALITGSSFLAIIIPAELYARLFRQQGLAAKNLSRTVEDSGTVIVPLVPWSMAGVYMTGTLGVPVIEYVPWAFMCWLGIVFAVIYGYTGIGIAPRVNEDETVPGS
jgi:NhaC family Na+:H+ antiporter